MRRLVVTPGDRYARLTVVREVTSKSRYRFVEVNCDCGKTKVVGLNDIRSGRTTSCGCFRNQQVRESLFKHGLSGTPEYRAWWDMVARCTDSTHQSYAEYGGRGITVCDEWVNDPEAFILYIGKKPSAKSVLDRINNNHGYCFGNVRWVTWQISNCNKRSSKRWTIDGVEYDTLTIASSILGIPQSTLVCWCKGWKCYKTDKQYPPRSNCNVRDFYEKQTP